MVPVRQTRGLALPQMPPQKHPRAARKAALNGPHSPQKNHNKKHSRIFHPLAAEIQNHQLNWWFAHTLEGFITGVPVNGYRNLATHHLSRAAAMSRLSFLPYLFFIPVNGSMYSLMLIWSCIWSSSSCLFIYSLITRSFRPTVST